MNSSELKDRTFSFAIRVINMAKSTRWNEFDKIIIRQLVRAATSVAANYRAALRSKSKRDFLYKLKIVQEEADECYFWMELIIRAGIIPGSKLSSLSIEANELTAIFTAQCKTVKNKLDHLKNIRINKNLKSQI